MRSKRSQQPNGSIPRHGVLTSILRHAFVLFACLSAFVSRADYNAFLFVQGIPGEVADVAHTNWIAINSFTEQQASLLYAPGLKSYSFNVTKSIDKSSPLLALRAANHNIIPSVHLQLVDIANTNHIYDLTFNNVTVAAFSQVSGEPITDTVQFNFQTVTWSYTLTAGIKPVATSWNLSQTNGTFPNQTYQGNGDTNSGGAIGGGTLIFTNDANTIYGTFTRGAGTFSNALVLYIDNNSGGFVDTSGFGDTADPISRAISGFDGANRSLLTFTNATKPFSPSYAIALAPIVGSGSGKIYQLQNGGPGAQQFIASANLSPLGTGNAYTYKFSFGMSQIGVPAYNGTTFRFLGSYVSTTGARSTEAIGSISGTSGWNPFATVDVDTYTLTAPAATAVAIAIMFDPQASTLNFSWPVSSTPYVLQQNADITSTNWITVTNSPTVVSNQNTVVLPVSNSTPNFYRLKY